jgi:hypothetical protein
LQKISFYSGFGTGFTGNAFQIMGGSFNHEIIPVPEPETYATAALLLFATACTYLFRRNRLLKKIDRINKINRMNGMG